VRRLTAAVAAAVLVLGGCSGDAGAGAQGGDAVGFVGGDGTVTIVPAEQREAAPVLAGPTVDGGRASTEDHAGDIIVVNVWGSWCAPCRKEAPELVAASEELGDEVVFLGVNTRENDVAPAQAFERSFGVGYDSIYDPDGRLLLGFGQLPPKAIPSTVVIDAEGRVAARILGAVDAKTLVGVVDDVRAGS